MIVLRRPRRTLDLQRAGEPEAVRVDLGGVSLEGLIPDLEEIAARHARRDLKLAPLVAALLRALRPLLEDLRVGRLQAAAEHLLVEGHVLRAVEGDEIVQLERLPRL